MASVEFKLVPWQGRSFYEEFCFECAMSFGLV